MDKKYGARKDASRKKAYFEKCAQSVGYLRREELTRRIKDFRGRFKIDFTDDYLNKLSVDRLRHIYLAALINNRPREPKDLESRTD